MRSFFASVMSSPAGAAAPRRVLRKANAPPERIQRYASPPPMAQSVDSYLQDFDAAESIMPKTGDELSRMRELANWLRQIVSGGSAAALDRRTLRRVLDELQPEIGRLTQLGPMTTRSDFAELVDALTALARLLVESKHPSSEDVRQISEEGQRLSAAWPATIAVHPDPAQVAAFLDRAADAMAKLQAAPARRRGDFWKGA
jgi:hypothetical protein